MALTGLKSKPLDQVRADVPVAQVAKGEPVRLNMNVAKETRAQWKRAAIDLDTDVTALIHEAMKEYLGTHWKR